MRLPAGCDRAPCQGQGVTTVADADDRPGGGLAGLDHHREGRGGGRLRHLLPRHADKRGLHGIILCLKANLGSKQLKRLTGGRRRRHQARGIGVAVAGTRRHTVTGKEQLHKPFCGASTKPFSVCSKPRVRFGQKNCRGGSPATRRSGNGATWFPDPSVTAMEGVVIFRPAR